MKRNKTSTNKKKKNPLEDIYGNKTDINYIKNKGDAKRYKSISPKSKNALKFGNDMNGALTINHNDLNENIQIFDDPYSSI
mmetsp:Transcript_23599/g.20518  ORF Transcript_23599/g.20518 Transcript_23599/m.20518 type:complete len:81 (+) Transcript_23599:2303-2545(+)